MDVFFWYVDDWLGSSQRKQMGLDEQAAYFNLLCHAAKAEDGGLPDDDYELAGLSELGRLWWKRPAGGVIARGERIRRCFFSRDGRIFNARLLKEFARRQEYRETRQRSAQAAAKARWADKKSDASGMRDACVTHTARMPDAMRGICVKHATPEPRPQTLEQRPQESSEPDFGDEEPYEWFCRNFPGELPETTWQVFAESVNTPERLSALHRNLVPWMGTPKYRGGYGKDAIAFLRSAIWLREPPQTSGRGNVIDDVVNGLLGSGKEAA